MFILAAERDSAEDLTSSFRVYGDYLIENRHRFPPSAYTLATSEWYYDFRDHRCPHDAWLEELRIEEPAIGDRYERRIVALRARLLGAYQDGYIELYYPRVYGYQLTLDVSGVGHGDWRYDEFRLVESGHLLHEIEWAGRGDTARWLIEASDVQCSWRPRDGKNPAAAV